MDGLVFQNGHVESAGDHPAGGAGRGADDVIAGLDGSAKIVVAVPMKGVLATASVATV
jgi:hypothetical protein